MTLRAKDLMVGDLVYNTKKEICKVCGVSCFFGESNFHLDNYSKENDGGFDLELEVFPIPLTPEILEKNGFKFINDEPFFVGWEQYGMVFCYREGGGFSVSILINSQIDYVHELQHLLRLWKIDKEIEL